MPVAIILIIGIDSSNLLVLGIKRTFSFPWEYWSYGNMNSVVPLVPRFWASFERKIKQITACCKDGPERCFIIHSNKQACPGNRQWLVSLDITRTPDAPPFQWILGQTKDQWFEHGTMFKFTTTSSFPSQSNVGCGLGLGCFFNSVLEHTHTECGQKLPLTLHKFLLFSFPKEARESRLDTLGHDSWQMNTLAEMLCHDKINKRTIIQHGGIIIH